MVASEDRKLGNNRRLKENRSEDKLLLWMKMVSGPEEKRRQNEWISSGGRCMVLREHVDGADIPDQAWEQIGGAWYII
ncbi:MAG: hypothetical protein ACLSHW_05030 [Lachnospiraceae bacterium]